MTTSDFISLFCFVLFKWWAGNCSITESLPELIQQVRQDLAGALEGQPEWQAGKDGSSDVLLSGSILSSIKLFFWSLRLHID